MEEEGRPIPPGCWRERVDLSPQGDGGREGRPIPRGDGERGSTYPPRVMETERVDLSPQGDGEREGRPIPPG